MSVFNLFELFLIVIVYVLSVAQSNEIPTYKCKHESNGFCYFNSINLTTGNPNFLPTSDRNPVTKVDLGGWSQFGSRLEVLTNDICNAFPEIEVLYGNSVSLTAINHNALEKCRRLTEISLSDNKLTHFPYDICAGKTNLTTIWLYSNNLMDLDVTKMMKSCVNLNIIYLNDNDIACSKMYKIISLFKTQNVSVMAAQDTKVRDYDMGGIAGVSCIPDENWIEGNKEENNNAVKNFDKILFTYLFLVLFVLEKLIY